MGVSEKRLTIVTPTYNRAYILPKVYDSLCKQSSMDFLWLIVDDGSNDNTLEIINKWQIENKIKIEYRRKENGGKASALNFALDIIDTDFVCCLDSDDLFTESAVENALEQLQMISIEDDVCGILALRNDQNNIVLGKKEIPLKYTYCTATDIFLREQLHTELICFYKTSIIKKFRFPSFENEKFISPAWMQYSVSQRYRYKTSWSRFCICEYVSDGLTKNKSKVIVKNPNGYTCVKRLSYQYSKTLGMLIKNGIMFGYGSLLCQNKSWLIKSPHPIISFLLLPFSYYVYIKRNKNV